MSNVTHPSETSPKVSDDGSTASTGPLALRVGQVVFKQYAALLLLLVLVGVFTLSTSNFSSGSNWSAILVPQAVTGTLALSAVFPLIVGEFDLSLGFALGFVSMFGAWLAGMNWSEPAVVIAMLAIGGVVGAVNGALTVYARIGSFIATLAVGTVLSAFTLGMSGGKVLFSNIPHIITSVARDKAAGISLSVWATVVLAIVCQYLLQHTPYGRKLYAVGGSERVSFLAGIRTDRMKLGAFTIAGVLVGFSAIFQLGQAGAAQAGFGPDLLLPAYGAAFLGLTVYRPGYYNVPGTVVAIVLLAVGFNGLSLMGVPFWVQPLFNGAVLLVAVLLARAESRSLQT